MLTRSLAFGCVLLLGSHVRAEPSLRVRAQASLELHTANTPAGLRLVGTLRDDLGAPLANRELTTYFEPQNGGGATRGRVARTDDSGRFAVPVSCDLTSQCRASVEFDGDGFYERTATAQVVEPQRAELQLEILEPSALALDLDVPTREIVVRASSAQGGGDVQLTLENELNTKLASAKTGADGSARFMLETTRLGEPGLGELVVRSPGDATRSAARSSKPLLRSRTTHTELAARYDAKQHALHLTVSLATQTGPIAQRAVGVFIDERHLTTLLTGADGRASQQLDTQSSELREGPHRLSARFESDLPGLSSSRSHTIDVRIEPPPRPSSAWLIAPALASLAFAIWSTRRAQRLRTGSDPSPASTPEIRFGATTRGRAGPCYTLSGRVEDVDSGQPLAAAIELSGAKDIGAVVQVHPNGEFASEPLAAGQYRARVLAPGYVPADFELDIPHHGNGSELRITLRSLRVVALDTYAGVAGRVVAEPRLSGATVRETMTAAMSGGRAGPSFEPLAHSVEQMAYAQPIPFEGDLLDLQRAAAAALEEIAERSPNPPDPGLGQ